MDDNTSSITTRFFHKLLPADETARKITLWMLVPVGLAYVGRIIIHQWLASERGPFGSMWWIICPIVCIVAAVLGAVVLGLAVFATRRAGHFAPALVLLGGIAAVPFLPLPPLPAPVFPEEEFFAAHRAEFEEVVYLAREGELHCHWMQGCEVAARFLPFEYRHLSVDRDVYVYGQDSSSFSVRFDPFTWYYPIIYYENPDEEALPYICQGKHTRHLDEHWYLCVEEWN